MPGPPRHAGVELKPADLAPRDPKRAGRRRLIASGIAGLVLSGVALNFLFAANERVSLEHPPDWGDFTAGVVLLALAAPFVAVAFRGRGASHILAWVGAVLVGFALFVAVGILMQPPH